MGKYTCVDYRQEMILASLRKRLSNEELTEEEQEKLKTEIKRLEAEIGL